MLIIGILVAGMAVGAIAQMLLGRSGSSLDWGMALVAGVGGSFVGGLLLSLLFGDGFVLGGAENIESIDFRDALIPLFNDPAGCLMFKQGSFITNFFNQAPGYEEGEEDEILEEFHEIAYSVGVEYWYRNQFAVRTGYFHEHASKGNRKYFTVGVGLRLNVFALDFSYLVPTNGQNSPLANTLRFTLGFDFADLNL